MNGSKLRNCHKYLQCLGTPFIVTLLPTSVLAESSESAFLHNSNYSTSYSKDVSTINPFTLKNIRSNGNSVSVPELGSRKKTLINKEDVGKLLYKTIKNPKKVAEQAAAGAAMVGLNYLEAAKPLKEGVVYIKEKNPLQVRRLWPGPVQQ